jgi:predicted small secreted protein
MRSPPPGDVPKRNNHPAPRISLAPGNAERATRKAELSRRPNMRKLITLAFVATGLTLSACNTVRGAANDVESTTDCADGKPDNC